MDVLPQKAQKTQNQQDEMFHLLRIDVFFVPSVAKILGGVRALGDREIGNAKTLKRGGIATKGTEDAKPAGGR
ncbi:MAG: hypothetical protein HOH58_01865 [Opitutaceae bacterium]|jgi:hypothetical protein|nr:hypothetical protein [Opitutaceae bacterium]